MKDLIKTHSISRFRSLKDLLFWLSGVRPSLPEPIIKLMCHSEHEFLLSEQFSCNLCLSLQGLIFPFSGRSKIERFLWYAEPATLKCQYDTAILKTEMPWDQPGTWERSCENPGNELGTKVSEGVTLVSHGSAVNGTRFVGSSHWKIPRKSGKSKKVVPFSRLEFPNGMSRSIYVSRSLYQFQVHGRAPPRTDVYDQMEQLFTDRKFHFCYHRNFRGFFLNGKRPRCHSVLGIPAFWASPFPNP